MLKGIIFDMDGVIINSSTLHGDAWKKTLENFDLPLWKKYFDKNHGKSSLDFAKYYVEKGDLKINPEEICKLKKLNYLNEIYKIKPLEYVLDFIKLLYENNYSLALATSENTETVSKIIDKFNLKNIFKIIVTADDVTKTKPDPEVFLKAANLLEINPKDCIVFEDAIDGIKAAKLAGIKCIGITTNYTKDKLNQADFVIDSFKEISIDIINKL